MNVNGEKLTKVAETRQNRKENVNTKDIQHSNVREST